jgi:hypothetical protein
MPIGKYARGDCFYPRIPHCSSVSSARLRRQTCRRWRGTTSREACANDRRGNFCVITDAGRAMRKKMWPIYRDQIAVLFSDQIDEKHATAIGESFEKILRALKLNDDE